MRQSSSKPHTCHFTPGTDPKYLKCQFCPAAKLNPDHGKFLVMDINTVGPAMERAMKKIKISDKVLKNGVVHYDKRT
jgi:hypothetical protein